MIDTVLLSWSYWTQLAVLFLISEWDHSFWLAGCCCCRERHLLFSYNNRTLLRLHARTVRPGDVCVDELLQLHVAARVAVLQQVLADCVFYARVVRVVGRALQHRRDDGGGGALGAVEEAVDLVWLLMAW